MKRLWLYLVLAVCSLLLVGCAATSSGTGSSSGITQISTSSTTTTVNWDDDGWTPPVRP